MGLHRLEESGIESPVKIKAVFERLLAQASWVTGMGDIGLLLWACALIAPERFSHIQQRWDLKASFSRFRDARHGDTLGLSLFLAGLSCQGIARPETLLSTRDLAFEAYRRIRMNQGRSGFFGHRSTTASIAGRISGEIGNFEDQAHAVHAITKFSEAYGNHRAIETALDCALALCEAQGQLGQWWWQYNSSNGRIVERFPVFSVHQHGIGPMALLALGEAIDSDFEPWVDKGLHWIEDNELGIEMRDDSAGTVSRGIKRTGIHRFWNTAVSFATGWEDKESCGGLMPVFECGPNELGWSLYALACVSTEEGRQGESRRRVRAEAH